MAPAFHYIFGPVSSWRLGSSLGVDLLSQKAKICTFDCSYCQLGSAPATYSGRRLFVPTERVMSELLAAGTLAVDTITLSGRGEPTLALNLGETIENVRKVSRSPIAVLTNASLMNRDDVRRELGMADRVVAKLDASSQSDLLAINRPAAGIDFNDILDGLRHFRSGYAGKFDLQIMFLNTNRDTADRLAAFARELRPDEVQINTPLRPCREAPLAKSELLAIRKCFMTLKTRSVYESEPVPVKAISSRATLKRRGKPV
jgi:wyosine [tRNA(Phe)-imidazoG37] synthetase (radical SAM superfamily)